MNSDDEIVRNRAVFNLTELSQQLSSDELRKTHSDQECYNYWKQEISDFTDGYNKSIEFLRENPSIFLELDDKNTTIDNCIISNCDFELLNSTDNVSKIISNSTTLQHLWNKSANVLTLFYCIANRLFEQRKLIECRQVFTFLTFMNPNIPSFWVGKGAANETLENWDKALDDYWMAQSIDPQDMSVYQALMRIYARLKDEQSLQECVAMIDSDPELKHQFQEKAA